MNFSRIPLFALSTLAVLTSCNIGDPASACSVEQNVDGSATVSCEDGTSATIKGTHGTDGASCTSTKNTDGSLTIACPGSEPLVLKDGNSCTVADDGQGQKTITCTDGTTASIHDAQTASCTVSDDGQGQKTITCSDGTSSTVQDGGPSLLCTHTKNDDYTKLSVCQTLCHAHTVECALMCREDMLNISEPQLKSMDDAHLAEQSALQPQSKLKVSLKYQAGASLLAQEGDKFWGVIAYHNKDLHIQVHTACIEFESNLCGTQSMDSVVAHEVSTPVSPALYDVRLHTGYGPDCASTLAQVRQETNIYAGIHLGSITVEPRAQCAVGMSDVTHIKINGQDTRRLKVKVNETVTLDATYHMAKTSCSGCVEFTRIGIPGQNLSCPGGTPKTCNNPTVQEHTSTFTISTPGIYPVRIKRGQVFKCEDIRNVAGSDRSTFAVIEVEP